MRANIKTNTQTKVDMVTPTPRQHPDADSVTQVPRHTVSHTDTQKTPRILDTKTHVNTQRLKSHHHTQNFHTATEHPEKYTVTPVHRQHPDILLRGHTSPSEMYTHAAAQLFQMYPIPSTAKDLHLPWDKA